MGKMVFCYVVFVSILLWMRFANAGSSGGYNINVVSYGARSDGQSDASQAFLKAWGWACHSADLPVTIYVPRGTFLLKALQFSGPCKTRITFWIDGNIVAPSNYWQLGNSGYWILFRNLNRISVRGAGTIDGRGRGFWACRRKSNNCPAGARSISFSWCNNVVMRGVTSLNSQSIHVALNHCNNVVIKEVKIRAPSSSPNTDGIHIQYSKGVTITATTIMTGDDCISIGTGSSNLWMERIACGPGHGISIGSLGDYAKEEGVYNVTVTSSTFTKTQNGVRIKSWARPSNGYASDIMFRNLIMKNVQNPIIIDQKYCPGKQGCPHQSSGVKISRVTYKNIWGTSATPIALNLYCSSSNPCWGIKLEDVKLAYYNKPATSLCANAHGTASGVLIPTSCLSTN
ncbi:hypothetical protein UlMin_016015 [Ulmus minor]